LSSGSGNGFSENARIHFHQSFGAGWVVLVDGLNTGNQGSTDGRIFQLQSNGHNQGVGLGVTYGGGGGWYMGECHLSSSYAQSHLNFGGATTGRAGTARVTNNYFDTTNSGPHVTVCRRGLQLIANYFRAASYQAFPVVFTAELNALGCDPAAIIMGNSFDVNNKTYPQAFVSFEGFTAADFANSAGGEYRNNLAHNNQQPMPSKWIAQFVGSDNVAISNTTSPTLELVQGPVLSA
jgi:hypothetical protein